MNKDMLKANQQQDIKSGSISESMLRLEDTANRYEQLVEVGRQKLSKLIDERPIEEKTGITENNPGNSVLSRQLNEQVYKLNSLLANFEDLLESVDIQ